MVRHWYLWVFFATMLLISAPTTTAIGVPDFLNPLRVLEAVSTFFRERGRYPYKHVHITSPEKAASIGEFDFVIVGAGVAGCVLANRLTERKNWTVLLLEAGRDENTITDVPVISAVWQSTWFNWGYRTDPQDNFCLAMSEQRCTWPRGKAIGGTSVINYMIYTRGHRLDYDLWASAGNEGWGYDDVLPYFKKIERVLIDEYLNSPERGHSGYLNVERPLFFTPLSRAFVQAGKALGYPSVDYNAQGPIGFSLIQTMMRNGSRCSANKAYLRPIRDRRNFYVTSQTQVTRVLIDPETKRATGVEYVQGSRTWTVRAKKEVILSAGVFNSPQLLMLSGVGPKDHLQEMGIPLVQDLKVGYNLMEHSGSLALIFTVNQRVSISQNNILPNPVNIPNYTFRGKGPLTATGGAEAMGFIRTNYSADERNDVELLFIGGTLASDDGTFVPHGLALRPAFYLKYFAPLTFRDGFSIWPLVLHPRSRGRVLLASNDPLDKPAFRANLLSDPTDMKIVLEGIKMALRVGQSDAFKQFGARLYDKPVPGCEGERFASDAYWECATRRLTAVQYHECGTCKMGPADDEDAVVDAQLRVRGVQRLRVVDASVMPVVPTAHTTAPTYMIAEKAADMIKEAWDRA